MSNEPNNNGANCDSFDIAVIGGGPAGLMAALVAARAGKSVVIIERNKSLGGKIPVSGGGHCNLSAMASENEYFERFGRQGRFISNALDRLGPQELMLFFSGIGLDCIVDKTAKIFPASRKAADVVGVLTKQLAQMQVKVLLSSPAACIDQKDGHVCGVKLEDGSNIAAKAVILCCGGKTYPALGSLGDGYRMAKQLGHKIVPTRCALAGLHVSEPKLAPWAGLTLEDIELSLPQKRRQSVLCRSSVVVTHVGLSGPAAMDISTYISAKLVDGEKICDLQVNFTPECGQADWEKRVNAWRSEEGAKTLLTLMAQRLGRSLAALVMIISGVDSQLKAAHAPKDAAEKIAAAATAAIFKVKGVDGFDKAMVTAGGVSLKQVDPRTCGSKLVSGLFFAGELLDLDGPTGGYNLQWAFSSGFLSGESAAAAVL